MFYINCPIQSNVEVTVKKTVISFTIIRLYLEQQLNVISKITVEIGTQLKTVKITSNVFAVHLSPEQRQS